ncbi:MAG: hypothetical protein PHV17_09480 [Candidatus Omnitrophica bacterium]|nr:hypothetical protein [Candidatus Omnitrophota bacterium]
MNQQSVWKVKLLDLDKRVQGFRDGYRQNIALLGQDPQEINYLLESYVNDNQTDGPLFIHTTTDYSDSYLFFKSVVSSILISGNNFLPEFDTLIQDSSEVFPGFCSFVKETLKRRDISFPEVLNAINLFISESNKKCVFIVENFLQLNQIFPNCFKDFSKFIILQRNCMIVLTASSYRRAEKIFSHELNLLFGNFEKIILTDKNFFDNYLYLKNMIEPLAPSLSFISFFVNIAGNNLVYYDALVDSVKKHYSKRSEDNSIVSILEESLYSKTSYLYQKFIFKLDNIVERFRDSNLVIKILILLSEGYLRKKEIASLGVCKTNELELIFSKLVDVGVVENVGNLYKIKDSLFSFWVLKVFKLYFCPSRLNSSRRILLWRKKTIETVDEFKEDFVKNKISRVLDLISSFKDDTLKIKKKNYILPMIENNKIMSYPQENSSIIIGEGKEILVVGIKEKNVSDNDIFAFIEKGKAIKGKKVRKIFISLERLNSTAKLIAKNNQLIVWDIDDVNYLLKIYNKPVISYSPGDYSNPQESLSRFDTKKPLSRGCGVKKLLTGGGSDD